MWLAFRVGMTLVFGVFVSEKLYTEDVTSEFFPSPKRLLIFRVCLRIHLLPQRRSHVDLFTRLSFVEVGGNFFRHRGRRV